VTPRAQAHVYQELTTSARSHRATGPHIDTCVCHLAGSRHPGRPGYLNCGDRLGKPDNEQGAHAVIVLSALANSLGKSVSVLIAFEDLLGKKVQGETAHRLHRGFENVASTKAVRSFRPRFPELRGRLVCIALRVCAIRLDANHHASQILKDVRKFAAALGV
jgi:hypothetical protein